MCDAVDTQPYDATQAAAAMQMSPVVIEIADSLPMGSPPDSKVCRSLARDFSKANLEDKTTGLLVSKEYRILLNCTCSGHVLVLVTNCH